MKGKSKKKIVLSIVLVVIVMSVYVVFDNTNKQNKGSNTSQIREEISEDLPNGQKKIIKSSSVVNEGMNQWLSEKESELIILIAEQTKLKSEDIFVMFAPTAGLENTDSYDLLCSIVLNTNSTFEDATIHQIIEDTVNIFKQDSAKVTISKGNIMITNGIGELLN